MPVPSAPGFPRAQPQNSREELVVLELLADHRWLDGPLGLCLVPSLHQSTVCRTAGHFFGEAPQELIEPELRSAVVNEKGPRRCIVLVIHHWGSERQWASTVWRPRARALLVTGAAARNTTRSASGEVLSNAASDVFLKATCREAL
eukprot:CAMPEP_0171185346 /NCGR_PEP_ID=MMETSP0790-20130122/16254_1 /TAXON_ID=2925 /ORGANISM="Alexandrium catenella, Strain OF101" /LENGTH=145 /DNA_ID=CAMNT_0011650365 /DNA_START=169 /DNA_END=607 /DNA_ORIENTATION=+